jgi:hypothetical protein
LRVEPAAAPGRALDHGLERGEDANDGESPTALLPLAPSSLWIHLRKQPFHLCLGCAPLLR